MKFLYTLVIALLISQYLTEDCEDKKDPSSYSDCKGLQVKTGQYTCCFIEEKYIFQGDSQNDKNCVGATKEEYDNNNEIKQFYKEIIVEQGGEVEDIKIDCRANNIFISFLLLIIILLF